MCGEEVGVVEDVTQLVQADGRRGAADGDHAGARAPNTHTLQTQTLHVTSLTEKLGRQFCMSPCD